MNLKAIIVSINRLNLTQLQAEAPKCVKHYSNTKEAKADRNYWFHRHLLVLNRINELAWQDKHKRNQGESQ